LEGSDAQHCLSVNLGCTENRKVAVVAEQANHSEELADSDHKDA
jgi:hypothetical protein